MENECYCGWTNKATYEAANVFTGNETVYNYIRDVPMTNHEFANYVISHYPQLEGLDVDWNEINEIYIDLRTREYRWNEDKTKIIYVYVATGEPVYPE